MSVQLKKNITIIVSVIVVENDNILMMQEAKPECLGLWYLPAGRLEKHETLVEGAKRECREETGLEIEPNAILSIEIQSLNWIRINFIGKLSGGTLKKKADKESLSADWIPISVVVNGGSELWPLRAKDIVKVVKSFVNRSNNDSGILPRVVAHTALQFRLYIKWEDNILIDKTTKEVPTVKAHSHDSFQAILREFIRNNFAESSPSVKSPFKILNVEFSGTCRKSGTITDGLLLELIIDVNEKHGLLSLSGFEWQKLSLISNLKILEASMTELPPLILLR